MPECTVFVLTNDVSRDIKQDFAESLEQRERGRESNKERYLKGVNGGKIGEKNKDEADECHVWYNSGAGPKGKHARGHDMQAN